MVDESNPAAAAAADVELNEGRRFHGAARGRNDPVTAGGALA